MPATLGDTRFARDRSTLSRVVHDDEGGDTRRRPLPSPHGLPEAEAGEAAPGVRAAEPAANDGGTPHPPGGTRPTPGEGAREGGPLVLGKQPVVAGQIGLRGSENADSDAKPFIVKGHDGEPVAIRSGADYAEDPRVKKYAGGGYLQSRRFLPVAVRGALVSALSLHLGAAPSDDDVRLAAHLWIVGALRREGADLGFVPVPFQVLARDAPGANMPALLRAGVLSLVPESPGRCREYALADSIADALDAALASAPFDAPLVNVYDGRRKRGRPSGSQFYDNGNAIAAPIADAMNAVPVGIVNVPSLLSHLDRLRAAVAAAPSPDERARARARWRTDALCFRWICERGLTPTDVSGIHTYPHAWEAQSAGRIMPRGSGGPQGMSRDGKAAMYAGVADVRNYDLRSSQPRIVQAEFRALGITCPWLDAYLADPEAKALHAARCGVEVDTWKAVFNAAMTAGTVGVPKRFSTRGTERYVGGRRLVAERPSTEAMKAVAEDVGRERAPEVWLRVRAELEGFLEAVGAWHRHLRKWAEAAATPGRGGRYLTNAVGAKLNVVTLSPAELPRKVAAFVLQGREALYVHTLCTLAERHGFRVVCHEHDGVVTLGRVPEAARTAAAQIAEMPYADLVEKPFTEGTNSSATDWQGWLAA